MSPERIDYLGVRFDLIDPVVAIAQIERAIAADALATVITPNVDHLVRLHAPADDPAERARIRLAYAGATLCLCDSRILARLAALDGIRLPVVPGSDLTRDLLARARAGARIAIVGGDAASVPALSRRFPALDFVQHRPPMGLRRNPNAMIAAAEFVEQAGARVSFLAVGSPQQELLGLLLAERNRARGVVLSVGASIDFLTGAARRAPDWMQRAHLEWAHRLLSDPARMWRRYLVDGPRILAVRRRWKADRRIG